MKYVAYDISLMSEDELESMSNKELESIQEELLDEKRVLEMEYFCGDRSMYPPDWYDRYIFPVSVQLQRIIYILADRSESDDE